MTEIDKDQLDDQLAQMTRWEGESTQLWREALDAKKAQPTASFWSARFLHWRVRPLAAVIAIVGGLMIVATFVAPEFGKSRDKARAVPRSASNLRQLAEAHTAYRGEWEDAGLSLSRYGSIGNAQGAGVRVPYASMTGPPLDLDAARQRLLLRLVPTRPRKGPRLPVLELPEPNEPAA